MTLLALFASTFALVFFLGLQSLNVNRGHYAAAFVTSFAIGIGQFILYKLAPDANGLEIAAYLAGGPLGIVTSMWVHHHIFPSSGHTAGQLPKPPPPLPMAPGENI